MYYILQVCTPLVLRLHVLKFLFAPHELTRGRGELTDGRSIHLRSAMMHVHVQYFASVFWPLHRQGALQFFSALLGVARGRDELILRQCLPTTTQWVFWMTFTGL